MNRAHRPLGFALCLAVVFLCRPSGDVRAEDAPAKDVIASKLQPFVESHTLAGAVTLVANREKVLDVETVGFADIAGHKPMRPDTVFWIASMSKPITGAALMILVDEGKVSLDDPIDKFLPEFKNQWLAVEQDKDHVLLKKPKQPVTVRHIMNHTSGMPFKSDMEQPTLDGLTLKDAVRSYAMTPLQTEPGTKYQYSNAGINTGGRIIEVVSGVPFETFLEKRICEPLGMKDTTFWPNEEQLSRLAKPYKPNADKTNLEETTIGQLTYPLNESKRQPMPAGGLFSTANDVSNFCRMVLAGGTFEGKKILSEEAVKAMTSHQTGDLPTSYGVGWATPKTAGGPFGHGGALSTNMQVDPQKGLVLVYLVQHAGYAGTDGGKILPTFQKTAADAFGK